MPDTTLPTTPGAIIGYRRNGTPIRLQAGASGPPEPAPAPDPVQPAAPAAAPEPPPAAPEPGSDPASQPAAEPAAQPAAEPGSVDQLPAWAQKTLAETRREAAAARTRMKELTDAQAARDTQHAEQMAGIARALGLAPEETTPEQLTAQRDQARADAATAASATRATQVELAVFRAASLAGVNANALLDSRTFVGTLDGLDPAGADFAQVVADRIAAAVEANPAWKANLPAPAVPAAAPVTAPPLAPPAPVVPEQGVQPPAVPASGPQGGFPSPPPPGGRQLTAADAANMTAQQVQEAINAGLFMEAGFGPARSTRR